MRREFTEDEKYKIWMDYVVTQVGLNVIPLELNTNHRKPEDRVGADAIVSIYTQFFTFRGGGPKYPIRDFDSFCSSDALYGWYERFKKRIFEK